MIFFSKWGTIFLATVHAPSANSKKGITGKRSEKKSALFSKLLWHKFPLKPN